MSASKLHSTHYYSPLKIESDQKQVIISQLKQQIWHLEKNREEFFILRDQYCGLEQKYRLLSEQKAISDSDFRQRHQMALRTIHQLQNQLDSTRNQYRERNLQLNDLESDRDVLKNQIDGRLIQIQKLKLQLNNLAVDNQQLIVQRSKQQQVLISLRRQCDLILTNIKKLELTNEQTMRKIKDIEKYLDQLKIQQNLLRQKIVSYENENNQLDENINSIMEDINKLHNAIYDSQHVVKTLQTNIAETVAEADKFKSQALHLHKTHQTQIMKNNDLNKTLNQADQTLKVRVHQVAQGRNQVQALRDQNTHLDAINNKLQDDVQFCRKHLQNLSLLNANLVLNLEKYSEQDEIVRNLIDRRKRVIISRNKVDETCVMLSRTTIRDTPGKISKLY